METKNQNQEPKLEIYRTYYSYGKRGSNGEYPKAYKKTTAISHKEARDAAVKAGVGEGHYLRKWHNVVKVKADNL